MVHTRATHRITTTPSSETTSATPPPDRLITRRSSAPTTTARTPTTTSSRWWPACRFRNPSGEPSRNPKVQNWSLPGREPDNNYKEGFHEHPPFNVQHFSG